MFCFVKWGYLERACLKWGSGLKKGGGGPGGGNVAAGDLGTRG